MASGESSATNAGPLINGLENSVNSNHDNNSGAEQPRIEVYAHRLVQRATIAIHAIGGLGHLAVQFANKFAYRTVAIGRGHSAKELSTKLGAHVYLDSAVTNAAQKLQRMGGARTCAEAKLMC